MWVSTAIDSNDEVIIKRFSGIENLCVMLLSLITAVYSVPDFNKKAKCQQSCWCDPV